VEFFIAVIVVLAGLNIFFLLIFRGITTRLGKFAQMNVLRQAGVFDDLIRSKQEQLQVLQDQIAAVELAADEQQAAARSTAREQAADYLEIRQGLYTSERFAEEYRAIRDNFQIDAADCVRRSLEQMAAEPTNRVAAARARAAQDILEEITLSSIYELSTLSSELQIDILSEMFTPEQLELLHEYAESVSEFQGYRFLFWLKDYIFANGEQVTVCTNGATEDFATLDGRIVTERDSSICEGIYLLSKGRKFDYSIRNREIIG
jgi:hypothetical protein